jgi:hypothetical protein
MSLPWPFSLGAASVEMALDVSASEHAQEGRQDASGTVKNGGVPNSKEGRSGAFRQLGTSAENVQATHR